MSGFISALLLCYVTLLTVCAEPPPLAQTDVARYRGHYLNTRGGRQVAAFNGIRYAKTPKRFQEAERLESESDEEVDATKDGDDCLQIPHIFNKYPMEKNENVKYVGSEDCLFLNVYTPSLKPEKPYPVMVYIHGGAFLIGTGASIWNGPEILLDRNVILVTLNYRLGIFGFLAYDEDVLPGNLGLKDQSLALQWVRNNIDKFGGDPDSITIFGESAGAVSVHLQMHSPRSRGLFHRAISQSGTMDCPWAFASRSTAKETALQAAAFLKCPTQPESLLKCLKEKTVEELIDAAASVKRMKIALEMVFKPVLETREGGFIAEEDILTKRSDMPWLGGVNSAEGLIFYAEIAKAGDRNLTEFNKMYKLVLPGLFRYETHPQAEKITSILKYSYLSDMDFSSETIQQFVNLLSDGLFIRGHVESAKKHRGKHYMYLLTHMGERSFSKFSQVDDLKLGVNHADDLFYLFPFWKVYPKLEFNKEDSKVVEFMLDWWTNFAEHGNPTAGKSGPQWYESEKGKLYVAISSKGLQLSKHLYSTRLNVWDNLPTNLHHHHELKDEL